MNKLLYLRNLKHELYKMDNKRKYSVFHEPDNNNLIVFSPYDDCDIDSVCGSIRDEIYGYLINVLNTQENVLVSWSQVSGTTSDYTIYYDMPNDELKNKSYKEIGDYLKKMNVKYEEYGFKYMEARDNIASKIEAKVYSSMA
ncbi:MAG TPA: hypothetical protein VIM42_09165 [Clostridium sp.]